MSVDVAQVVSDLTSKMAQAKSPLGDPEDWQPSPADVQMLFLEALRLCISIDVDGVASPLRQHLDDLVDACCKVSLARAWRELGLVGPAKVDARYGALLGVDSSKLLLRRVEQTVAFLRSSVGRNNPDDMERAYTRACELAEGFVLRLSSVAVGEASESAGGVQAPDFHDHESLGELRPEELVSDEHFQRLSRMFVSSVDDEEGTLSRAIVERDDRHAEAERFGEACDAILEELRLVRTADARSVVARTAETPSLPKVLRFSCLPKVPHEKLVELLHEVERSLVTYRRYVTDFGLMGAMGGFASASDCAGWSRHNTGWCADDSEVHYSGVLPQSRHRGASLDYFSEELDGPGDDHHDIVFAIDRMRKFNAIRYEGILDLDPSRYVNAFWYGLSKLGRFADCAVEVDESAWGDFCVALKKAAWTSVGPLAARMDEKQAKDYTEAVDKLLGEWMA